MCNNIRKPKKSPTELVEQMKSKGIRFTHISESEAVNYLSVENNYLRTASYKKNYAEYQQGKLKKTYLDLDFAYLRELSAIDMHLRRQLLSMCIDLEHSFKLKILNEICSRTTEDGYAIVSRFLAENPQIASNIARQAGKFFTGSLLGTYFDIDSSDRRNPKITKIDCPVWVLIEILTFGDFLHFYKFYYTEFKLSRIERGILNPVKDLRNACAHNNCLLTNLRPQEGEESDEQKNTQPSRTLSQFVSRIDTISKDARKKRLKCRPIFDIVCLLYLQKQCMEKGRFYQQLNSLKSLLNGRVVQKKDYFIKNDLIKSSYLFTQKVVDFLIAET